MSELKIKYLKDYKEVNFSVNDILLEFDLIDDKLYVKNTSTYYKNNLNSSNNSLILDGDVELSSLKINNDILNIDNINIVNNQLILNELPQQFTLEINTIIYPWQNKSCMGIYASKNNIVSQCEAEGFRKITFFQDRPDVMAKYTVIIKVPVGKYNSILSNGNLISKVITNGTEIVTWIDPYNKPSYLFALVIGNFVLYESKFVTKSEKEILLQIYAEEKYVNDLKHAMNSLQKAMQWDEERFNLEYDLDRYMIVATPDFNMGAMENKGLNIFNTKYVIANQQTATDQDFINVEAVIGHEYFHNWTGNRVTCKNWFQLSLKEGLTVFRDQEFTADLHSKSVKRIQDVSLLKKNQFPEDSGPLAHLVRPFSYIQMNNFYTMTIYEKGAEIVRMYQTILSKNGFKKGLDLYFKRFDGKAVTVEDFYQAMSDANNYKFEQFIQWYNQFGTPEITVESYYDSSSQQYIIDFTQYIPTNKEQSNVFPLLIPIEIGLLDNLGHELIKPDISHGNYLYIDNKLILLIDNWHNRFIFNNIKTQPIPSLLRNFSAPIKLHFKYSNNDKLLLLRFDSDAYNRFEILQSIFKEHIIKIYQAKLNNTNIFLSNQIIEIIKLLVTNINLDPAFRAILFTVPSINEILTTMVDADPKILYQSINQLNIELGEKLFDIWLELYNANLTLKYNFKDYGKRQLKNTALFYIIKGLANKHNNHSLQLIETLILGQFNNSDNMTDSLAVLSAINDTNLTLRIELLNKFYNKWSEHELVMDKWLALQSSSINITINDITKLMLNKVFIATNPNKIYALLRTFTNNINFHSQDGYNFITTQIIAIDKFNPQLASTLMNGFSQVVQLKLDYRKLAKDSLYMLKNHIDLSSDVKEKLDKIYDNIII
jgi:aminopeptidase N